MTVDSTTAIVIGCSIAGMSSAAVLAKHYERVIVIERDKLVQAPASRPGTPQDVQVHFLLKGGEIVLSRLFPGIVEKMTAAGALRADIGKEYLWSGYNDWRPSVSLGIDVVQQSRPQLEYMIRAELAAIKNITILDNTKVSGYLFNTDSSAVVGVTTRERGGMDGIDRTANLVVDASGRGSSTPAKLAAAGFVKPEEELIDVEVGYAGQLYRLEPGKTLDWRGIVISPIGPERPTGAAVLPIEDDLVTLTLYGYLDNYPPEDEDGIRRFLKDIRFPHQTVSETLLDMKPASKLNRYRFTGARRRKYEQLARFPDGLVVLGDALCSVDPVFGQGMSLAMLEAEVLDNWMSKRSSADMTQKPRGLEFFREATGAIGTAWRLIKNTAAKYPSGNWSRTPEFCLMSSYYDAIGALALEDDDVLRKYLRVTQFIDAESTLFTPEIISRVVRQIVNSGAGEGSIMQPGHPQ
ncbi:FAD-dependent oxidoreductase [Rhizorhapis sp. SPR117]|uniref:FAD-dependent oxidoreductase n=1 Tax=Rhizorhapis sp. SPR117 TaxID=2912611 RepID=UPI001F204F6F|nr:hypothetical protein [Rhizorhapis sp. SPR117]